MTTTRRKPLLNRMPSIESVEAYLLSHGWRKIDTSGPRQNVNIMIFHGPADVEGNPLTIGLSTRADSIDAKFLIQRAIRILSVVEAKPQTRIINEIESAEAIDRAERPHDKSRQAIAA